MERGALVSGMHFFDENEVVITGGVMPYADENEQPLFKWTPLQNIPEGERIIGFKASTEGARFVNVSFILGAINQPNITRELRYPELEIFPDFEQF